jgi:hypothetical protein
MLGEGGNGQVAVRTGQPGQVTAQIGVTQQQAARRRRALRRREGLALAAPRQP